MNALLGKYYAARSLLQFRRHLKNWREVWNAYRNNSAIPDMQFRRGGLTLYHDAKMDDLINLWREICCDGCYTKGFYEPSPGDVVVDLGANIGTFALYLESVARGIKVHCYEPAARTRDRLNRNVEQNNLASLVQIHPYAVAGKAGVLRLQGASLAAQRSLYASEFTHSDDEAAESIECVTLSDAVDRAGSNRIDLLKIDIEGAEVETLENTAVGVLKPVLRIAVEYHDRIKPGAKQRVGAALVRHGFTDIREFLPDAHLAGMGLLRANRGQSGSA